MFDIDNYNKCFTEETKNYTKICKGKPCEYADECDRNGKIVYCNRDDKKKELYYLKGRIGDVRFSFKDMCKRDDFPNGINKEVLQKLYDIAKEKYPELVPTSIDVWVEELKEMGMYKE